MGGGGRYPYPKHVWSPTGGWWSQPTNWKSNTAIVAAAMLTISYFTWRISAKKEVRTSPPNGFIPSMMWADQFKEGGEYEEIAKKYREI